MEINIEHCLKLAEILLLLASFSISIFTVVNQNASSNQIQVLIDLKEKIPSLNSTIMSMVEDSNDQTNNKFTMLMQGFDDHEKRIRELENTIEKGEILILLKKYDPQDIKALLDVEQNVKVVSDKVSNLQTNLIITQNEIINFKTSVNQHTNDISSFQTSLSNVQTNLQTIKTDVTNLNPSIIKNTNDISSVQTTLSNVQSNLQNQVNNLQASNTQTQNQVTLMKTNLETKINDDENLKRKLNYMYYPDECIIYQDIFQALNAGIIQNMGNKVEWDESSFHTTEWNERKMIRLGKGVQSNGNGLLVDVPESYIVLWIHVINDRNNAFRVSPYDIEGTDIEDRTEKYGCGFRRLIEYGPDGGPSHNHGSFAWVPIVLRKKGKYIIYSDVNSDLWIAGIAFSKNPWNHAKNSGIAFYLNLNGGSNILWFSNAWNNDVLVYINQNTIGELNVPVIPNGKEKMLYFLEHNNFWEGIMHFSIEINGKIGERLRVYSNNPFATHCNSKLYCRYVGTKVPSSWIGSNDNFLNVKISMMKVQNFFHFREAGTHDFS